MSWHLSIRKSPGHQHVALGVTALSSSVCLVTSHLLPVAGGCSVVRRRGEERWRRGEKRGRRGEERGGEGEERRGGGEEEEGGGALNQKPRTTREAEFELGR